MHYVDIETACDLTRGTTVVDRLGVAADERNRATWDWALKSKVKTQVDWTLDIAGWKAALFAALK